MEKKDAKKRGPKDRDYMESLRKIRSEIREEQKDTSEKVWRCQKRSR